jgi:hypothetical protein
MVTEYLTRQPDPLQTTRGEALFLSDRHRRRFTIDELDTTCGTARVTATCVHDIDAGIMLDC